MLQSKSTYSSFFTGAAMVVSMMAGIIHAGEFDPKPFTSSDESLRQTLVEQVKEGGDPLASVELGRLYSLYNRLDEAHDLLSKAVDNDPKNAAALVWLGATNAKIAGKAFPWDMGIRKLYLVKKGLRQVDEAVAMDGTNFDVIITSIITDAKVKRFGALAKAQSRIKPLLAGIDDANKGYTSDAKAAIYLAASHVANSEGNMPEAKKFVDKAKSQNPDEGLRWQIDDLVSMMTD
jgi:tetratricopeptide (TPR) repeat protein